MGPQEKKKEKKSKRGPWIKKLRTTDLDYGLPLCGKYIYIYIYICMYKRTYDPLKDFNRRK